MKTLLDYLAWVRYYLFIRWFTKPFRGNDETQPH